MDRRLLVATFVALCVSVSGCSKKSDGASSASNDDALVTDPLTGMQRPALPLPDGWPSNVPVYAGAVVAESITVGREKRVVLVSADPIDKVAVFYKEKLSGMGVQRPSDFDQGEKRFVTFSLGEAAIGGITIETATKATKVTLIITALKR